MITLAPPPVVSPTKTPQEALEHAAAYIEEHGWVQGCLQTVDGQVCAAGAILAVTESGVPPLVKTWYGGYQRVHSPLFDETVSLLTRYLIHEQERQRSRLDRLLGRRQPVIGVPPWNDMDGRTVDEVTAALRAAARL